MFKLSPVLLVALFACTKNEQNLHEDDFHEPRLELKTPGEAAWSSAGEVDANGEAEFLTDLQINGDDAETDGDGFSATVELLRGMNVVEARGTDEHGDDRFVRNGVLAGEFGDPGVAIDNAAEIRLNQGGLDVAGAMAGSLIDVDTINGALTSANPVYQDSYGLFGWDAVTIRADVVNVYFDPPQIHLTPSNGVLEANVVIPNLWVDVVASGDVVGIDFDVDVAVWAAEADITGDLTLDAENGRLVADLPSARVNLVGFGYDTSLLPGDVESYILVDTIRGYIEDTLVEQIEAQVPALLAEQLSTLSLSFETELMGKNLSVEAEFASAGIDRDGVVLDVDVDVYVPSGGEHQYEGFLLASGSGGPDADTNADVGLSMSDDMLNRLLFEVWRGGMLDLTLSTDDGSLEPIMLAQLHATEGSIRLKPRLPPVVVQKNGRLQAQLGEMIIVIDTPGGELGEHLEASLNLNATLDLSVQDGALKLKLTDPATVITVRNSDWGASNETVTNLLSEMLPVDTLLSVFGSIEIPLPTVGGLAVDSATVSREESGVYTGVAVTLQ